MAQQKRLEFKFVNFDNEVQDDLKHAVGMVAYFDCLACGFMLCFSKKYDPLPLHYESLLRICKPVTCPKCQKLHYHKRNDEGEDVAELFEAPLVDPNQLCLF